MEASLKYHCATCKTDVYGMANLKEHHRCAWHRYNMKRKLADFPEVSQAEFDRKISLLESSQTIKRKGKSHLKNTSDTLQSDGVTSGKVEALSIKPLTALDCFFDTKSFSTVQENLVYMQEEYSFFLPNYEYIKDIAGVFTYLAQKLYYGHQCLFCNRSFKSLHSVRKHMIDKGHTSVGVQTEEQREELDSFYEFPKPVYDNGDADLDGQSGGDLISEDVWDTESDDTENEDTGSHHVLRRSCPGLRVWRCARINEVGNLVLPSGIEVAHRAIAYIYRQRVRVNSTPACVRAALQQGKQKCAMHSLNTAKISHLYKLSRIQSKSFQCDRLRRDLDLGMKHNKLQKTIRRQEKYFL